ncbi:FixH family protein [Capnocytophaga canimorsus]|uniref:FixH family protein n=1 Tax=Capnocytophaga canimorsus TaxID=28188 RepID=UPI001AD3AFF9|nr:FixH family protein [Capnocytophaga canimorsus]GIM58221.1 cytochrome Cbb3 oxidase maturation protein CcoH [Capnocytophaga canimorsus]
MKINWGTGIVLAFVFFIAFILYFVIQMSTNKKYDHELVTEEYYKKELAFQESLQKENKTQKDHMTVKIEIGERGLSLNFPNQKDIQGFVNFYRPSDKSKDFQLPIQVHTGQMFIPMEQLAQGRWNVQINYVWQGEEYMSTHKINIK